MTRTDRMYDKCRQRRQVHDNSSAYFAGWMLRAAIWEHIWECWIYDHLTYRRFRLREESLC